MHNFGSQSCICPHLKILNVTPSEEEHSGLSGQDSGQQVSKLPFLRVQSSKHITLVSRANALNAKNDSCVHSSQQCTYNPIPETVEQGQSGAMVDFVALSHPIQTLQWLRGQGSGPLRRRTEEDQQQILQSCLSTSPNLNNFHKSGNIAQQRRRRRREFPSDSPLSLAVWSKRRQRSVKRRTSLTFFNTWQVEGTSI